VSATAPLPLSALIEEDIAWACSALGLPALAFNGSDGNDPRLKVILSSDPLDIEACPGSGKTTLLVAKLAILARNWTERRRGICVLSHTNVARREIEERLGGTPEGKRLLAYPHFVGTIHGFVNEFLAIPWLRSKPLPIRMIDDDICLRRRWFKLPTNTRFGLQKRNYDHQVLRIADADYSLCEISWGNRSLSSGTETYQAIQTACRQSCEEGFFCHGEMFIWAAELLDRVPQMQGALRQRFPLLFLDEVQDTSEEQSALLYRIFMERSGPVPVIRQRFGDSNQAIFQYSGQKDGAQTDPFPEGHLRMPIPNSYRFSQQIADLANPLGLVPHGLIGLGPRTDVISTDVKGKHAVFLFDELTIENVLPCYASYLIELFSAHDLQKGTFTAVGAVHRSDKNDKIPRYVPHYWPDYDPDLASIEPRPRTFLQCLAVGRRLTRASGESHHVVDKIADGILRLASLLNPLADLSSRKRRHRYIRELLSDNPPLDEVYLSIVSRLMAGDIAEATADWTQTWVPRIMEVALEIAGAAQVSDAATTFMALQTSANSGQQQVRSTQRDNVFRFPPRDPKVHIRVGSIHSVKGETHTATLVLETFYKKHNLATLKPWLTGDKSGQADEGPDNISRLKQHYVGMTRPGHLLCLAMRENSLLASDIAKLKIRWRVGRIGGAGIVWL